MQPPNPSDPSPKQIQLEKGLLSYVDEGKGPTILLVHGMPGSHRDFRWLVPTLSAHFRVIRPDLPGFGGSLRFPFADSTPQARAAVLADFVRTLGLGDITLLGHSVGTAISVALAAKLDTRIKALALLAPVGMTPHREYRKWPVKRMARLIRIPPIRWVARGQMRKVIQRAGFPKSTPVDEIVHATYTAAALNFEEHAMRVKKLTCPTMVAWAIDDPAIEPSICETLAANVPAGPHLRFDDGGHNIQKAQAVEIGESLSEWILGI